MMNIKIGQKLVVGFILVAMISLIIGVIAIVNLGKISTADKALYLEATLPVSEIGQVATYFQRIRIESRDMIRANDASTIEKHANNIEGLSGQITPLMESFEKSLVTNEEQDTYKEFKAARVLYRANLAQMEDLARQNRDAEAYNIMNTTAKDNCAAEQAGIDKMVKLKVDKARLLSENNTRLAASARTIMVICVIIGVIIAIFLGLMIARSITQPVNLVVAMIKDIAQGEGDLTKRLNIASKDEVGELALWFNTFVEKLHDIIYQVATATSQIASATQELASTAEQMAAGAEEQTSQTSQVATSMEEMSATVQQVAKNSGTAAGKAKSAGEVATKGGDVVAQTVQGMNKIADTVKELQQVVGGLSRNSEKIGNIVGVIDDVADQTNLLALNAAIEAARAGEQGRGFAVVADEVRKLAERTTASTKEIASMVKNIQEDTGKAVGSMEVSAKEVSSGVTLANQAGSSLQEIVHEAKGVQEMVQQIATAAEEQSAAAEEISSNVESIASVSKQNAAASEQTSAASQEISRLTDDLQSLVGKFKLNKQVERKQAVARAAHTAASAASYPRQEKKVASFKKELGLDKGAQASA